MQSITLIIVHALFAQALEGKQDSVDKLVDRAFRAWSLQGVDLENATLGKPRHFNLPTGSKYKPGIAHIPSGIPSTHLIHSGWPGHRYKSKVPVFVSHHTRGAGDLGSHGANLQRRSGHRVRASQEDESSENPINVLLQQVPFVTDQEVLAPIVLYSCPVEYQYATVLNSGTTGVGTEKDDDVMFESRMQSDQFTSLMSSVRQRLSDLNGNSWQVLSKVRPQANKLLCRWEVSFKSTADHLAKIEGTSEYLLEGGKVKEIRETWETYQEKPLSAVFSPFIPWHQVFQDSLAFQQTRRPIGASNYIKDTLLPAYKYAVWETIKNDETLMCAADERVISDCNRRRDFDGYIMEALYSIIIWFGFGTLSAFTVLPVAFRLIMLAAG